MLDGSHEVQPAVRLKCPRGGGDAPWLGSWLADVRRRPSAARLWRGAAARRRRAHHTPPPPSTFQPTPSAGSLLKPNN